MKLRRLKRFGLHGGALLPRRRGSLIEAASDSRHAARVLETFSLVDEGASLKLVALPRETLVDVRPFSLVDEGASLKPCRTPVHRRLGLGHLLPRRRGSLIEAGHPPELGGVESLTAALLPRRRGSLIEAPHGRRQGARRSAFSLVDEGASLKLGVDATGTGTACPTFSLVDEGASLKRRRARAPVHRAGAFSLVDEGASLKQGGGQGGFGAVALPFSLVDEGASLKPEKGYPVAKLAHLPSPSSTREPH